jgi:U3 small nucleolar RNA-associated protein 13
MMDRFKSKFFVLIFRNQDLDLFFKRKDYKNACILALELDQPFKILNILKSISSDQFGTGSAGLDEYFLSMELDSLTRILKYLLDWNTSLKNVKVVSNLLNLILTGIPSEKLLEIKDIKKIMEGLVVYSKGHFDKVGDMERNAMLVDYTLERMDGVVLR